MAVAGPPKPRPDHAADMARVVLRIGRYISIGATPLMPALGISASASLPARYRHHRRHSEICQDIFGPGVNLAARMEGLSEPMRITVSSETYDLIRKEFNFKGPGIQEVKGFGPMDLFYLEGEKERTSIRRKTRI